MAVSVRRVIDLASVTILALALVFAVRVFLARNADLENRTSDYAEVRSIPPDIQVAASTGHRLGPADATTVVMVFWDYACSFCRRFDEPLGRIRDRYPEHVAVVLKHFVPITNDPILKVALGIECAADQGAFARYHAEAMKDYHTLESARAWRTIADSALSPAVDRPRFDVCVQSATFASNIARDYQQGRALGVDGTPTYFINGERFDGATSFERLDSLVTRHFPRRRVLQ